MKYGALKRMKMPNIGKLTLQKVIKKISVTDFTLSSLHGTQVGILCVETVQHVGCLLEVVNVLKRSE